MQKVEDKYFNYSPRALWLRAIVLGGLEGLASSVVMMMGIGMFTKDNKVILLTSFTSLVAASMNLAIAEFVSVYAQYDIMMFQAKRDLAVGRDGGKGMVPSPTVVAVAASATYFVCGSVPLLSGFIGDPKWRSLVATMVASFLLIVVGVIGAALGKVPVARSCLRLLLGGWLTISIIWGKNYVLGYIGI
ncbi:hypothetical protein FNV43_RR07790 [Rhamnella rubrinervis]|uniref:Vacuolar iron transporter n=1 Tax=Rhamnella rubrinervis TaxID=2594499 RepID=A0A8K0HH89_9ROSA|nr:hypothetical protein FNV43_RR07790 [Rhamnella rubrinervis]